MKNRSAHSWLLVALVAIGLLCSTAVVTAGQSEAAPRHRIHFAPCPGSSVTQCGVLRVPADWSHPSGPKISVAVARRFADDPAHRIGTLFFNPGGPGDGGVKYVIAADTFFSDSLRARFDIISVDPRGVGASTPISCGVPALTPEYTFFPHTQREFDAMVVHNRAVARSCLQETGPLLLHADTVSVARDHEALRIALHVSKVSWLGLSYGTQLGAQYAQLYPNRTRAMVLDAVLDHSISDVLLTADAATTVEEAFNRFASWCDTAPDCALRGQNVATVYDALVQRAQANPIPVEGALRPVTGDDIRMRTPDYLLAKTPNVLAGELSWPVFSQILKRAVDGDASSFAWPPPNSATDNIFARLANHCGDYASDIHTFADMQQRIEMGRQLAPHLQGGSEFWLGVICVGWPFEVANPVRRLDIRGVPTLIVHANHDPSVSYQWAFQLATQIRGSSVLTRNGDGHTSYYTSECAQVATDQFLLTKQSAAAPVCAT